MFAMKKELKWKINKNITKNILINYLRKMHGIVVAKLSSDAGSLISIAGNCFTICRSFSLSSSSVSTSSIFSDKQHFLFMFHHYLDCSAHITILFMENLILFLMLQFSPVNSYILSIKSEIQLCHMQEFLFQFQHPQLP